MRTAQDNKWLVKVWQTFHIQKLHHGLMIVGPSGCGKSADAAEGVGDRQGCEARVRGNSLTRTSIHAHKQTRAHKQTDTRENTQARENKLNHARSPPFLPLPPFSSRNSTYVIDPKA